MSTYDVPWCERERRTARLVRALWEEILLPSSSRTRKPVVIPSEALHALCKLTWITKGGGRIADNTRSVVVPALSTILGVSLTSHDRAGLRRELARHGVASAIATPAAGELGFVNFYPAFRNSSLEWTGAHRAEVQGILTSVADATTDDQLLDAYRRVEELERVPRAGEGGPMAAWNLLTPLMACLDRRGRAPIINGSSVQEKLGALDLAGDSLAEQCRGLMGLIGQGGIADAFQLDTTPSDELEDKFGAEDSDEDEESPRAGPHRPLPEMRDEDILVIRAANVGTMTRRHNSLTNLLRQLCRDLDVSEGRDPTCRYDALVVDYDGNGRDLLIEVKTEATAEFARMAVGQLLDYRRKVPRRAATDLAVLFHEPPPGEVMAFLRDVSVKVLWERDGTVEGDLELGAER